MSLREISPRRVSKRSLAIARIWSVTATTVRPAHCTGIKRGGLAAGDVDKGTTTTVRRRSFTTLVDKIRHGRVLAISEPNVGSCCTHQTSPRRGIGPRFGYVGGDSVELLFDGMSVLA